MSKKKLYGFELLAHEAATFAANNVLDLEKAGAGDTPIEKLLFAALLTETQISGRNVVHVYCVRDQSTFDFMKQIIVERREFYEAIIVWPQYQMPTWRVDFLVFAPEYDSAEYAHRALIVECDGHDFHERTKEQAAKDRGRDRQAQIAGLPVFRFTGSELYRAPLKCAAQVIDWAEKGV